MADQVSGQLPGSMKPTGDPTDSNASACQCVTSPRLQLRGPDPRCRTLPLEIRG